MLFEATGLALRYDPGEPLVVYQVVIDKGNLPAITNITVIRFQKSSLSAATGDAVCALGGSLHELPTVMAGTTWQR
jgi:hypothetical protein